MFFIIIIFLLEYLDHLFSFVGHAVFCQRVSHFLSRIAVVVLEIAVKIDRHVCVCNPARQLDDW